MKIKEIKEMFDRAYGFDIATKTRIDEYVQARKTYCKLARELGFGLQNIGDSINRDHATALQSVRTSQTITDFDIKVNVSNSNNRGSSHYGPDIDDIQLKVVYTYINPLTPR